MNDMTNAPHLPGFRKSSFALPYNGGEIWFEHLDGLYGHEALALENLAGDAPLFSRPSSPAYICFVLDETAVTAAVVDAVKQVLFRSGKRFLKIAFTGLDRKSRRSMKRSLTECGCPVGFLDGLEQAKEWLLP